MNTVEIGLSFLEGLALIASPCILPVLPLVLSASVEGGRRRPFGIILGFVTTFTLFALLSRKLVMEFHIDLDYIKYGSLALLVLFACVLLSQSLSEKFSAFTQRFANIGGNVTSGAKEGFGSGILIGMLIGLIWTPCAGPILAAVLVQVIREQSDLLALFQVGAFALGAGIPMLVISLAGRKVMARLGFFTTHADTVRKTFGIIILLAVVFIAAGADIQSLVPQNDAIAAQPNAALLHTLGKPYPAPEFVGIDGWLNSEPLTMKSLKGKVVLVDFWTYSCINCVRTLPYITAWDSKYRDKGLVIVGVSAPEFEFEKSSENVKAAVVKHGIKYPVALDNRLDTWTNFKNRFWPAHYLIDKEGNVVYTHFGEGDYEVTENAIRSLLGIADKVQQTRSETEASAVNQTHETYLGNARMMNFSSRQSVALRRESLYEFPELLPLHSWALNGKWKIEPEKIVSSESGAALRLNFNARKVFLVLGSSTAEPVSVSVLLNGKEAGADAGSDVRQGKITLRGNTLYELIDQKTAANGLLEIRADGPGLEAYAFTFGG